SRPRPRLRISSTSSSGASSAIPNADSGPEGRQPIIGTIPDRDPALDATPTDSIDLLSIICDIVMKKTPSLALLLASCAAIGGGRGDQPTAPARKPPLVRVSMPLTDTVEDFEDFTGRTDAIYSVTVNARVTGYLDKVNFVDGTEVNEGDLLFEIDPRPY